ncbi:MAG: hypothetical protein ACE5IM_13820, partial [Nitrospinota bacterium]
GLPEFRWAHLLRDPDLLAEAREEAFCLVEGDPRLSAPGHAGLRSWVRERWGERLGLADVG